MRRLRQPLGGRLPRGGVDRNRAKGGDDDKRRVASHAEAWIETLILAAWKLMPAVASHAEAWIETSGHRPSSQTSRVASHAEAWIETSTSTSPTLGAAVASHAEAWIETSRSGVAKAHASSRLPRGGVDRNAA